MVNKHRPDWGIVSHAGADHEIWQNRYGRLAMKTQSGTWEPLRLADAYEEITLAARINAAVMLLGLTKREAAAHVGCAQQQLEDWANGKRHPRKRNESKLELLLIDRAMSLELGQSRSLMQGPGRDA